MVRAKKSKFNDAAFKLAYARYQEYLGQKGARRMNEKPLTVQQLAILLSFYMQNPDIEWLQDKERMYPELRAMRAVFGVPEMVRRMKLAIEKDKYRPRNMRIFDFVAGPDLDYIGGDVSTFNPGVARLKKSQVDLNTVRRRNTAAITNMAEVTVNYANNWMAILDAHPRWLREVMMYARDMDAKRLGYIFEKISYEMMARQGIDYKLLNVFVVDDWNDCELVDKNAIVGPNTRGMCRTYVYNDAPDVIRCAIVINRKRCVSQDDFSFAIEMIEYLAHEYAHFVDKLFANKGMLGEQISDLDHAIYNNKDKVSYNASATEVSSFDVGYYLVKKLTEKYNRG